MTAKSAGKYVFSGVEIAAMFYIALTQHLSRTSLFTDSRRAVLQAAQSLVQEQSGGGAGPEDQGGEKWVRRGGDQPGPATRQPSEDGAGGNM